MAFADISKVNEIVIDNILFQPAFHRRGSILLLDLLKYFYERMLFLRRIIILSRGNFYEQIDTVNNIWHVTFNIQIESRKLDLRLI